MTEYEQNRDSLSVNVVKKESGRPGRKKQIKKNQEEIENNENIDEEMIIKENLNLNPTNNINNNGLENGVEKG